MIRSVPDIEIKPKFFSAPRDVNFPSFTFFSCQKMKSKGLYTFLLDLKYRNISFKPMSLSVPKTSTLQKHLGLKVRLVAFLLTGFKRR